MRRVRRNFERDMKLFRWGPEGAERPGVIGADGRRLDASTVVTDYDRTLWLDRRLDDLRELARSGAAAEVPADARLGAPVPRPGKVVCIGLNYRDHAAETGASIPSEPVMFMKATTAVCGPFDDLVLPPGSEATDWEVELALVIGRRVREATEAEALAAVGGYTMMIDYSERSWQKERGGQWMKGKSYDRFAPLGPWLATPDEVPDPQALALELRVNDEVRQAGSTADMIFPVARLVAAVSEFMTLEPGDVISTGTPAGVGAGMRPPRFLSAGDVVTATVEGLGTQRQAVIAALKGGE